MTNCLTSSNIAYNGYTEVVHNTLEIGFRTGEILMPKDVKNTAFFAD